MDSPLQDLAGCCVLLVEDEYYVADDLEQILRARGSDVLGPVPTLLGALAIVQSAERIDVGLIDFNLREQMAYPVADALEERGVPFVFTTGYAASAIPARYQHVPRWEIIRLPDTATVLVHDTTETVMWRRFTRVPPSTGTGSAKRSLQRSVAVQWKDSVIRRKVRFRDFEPTGALNLPKRFLPSLAVGPIAPSATCPNLRMVR